MGQPGRGTNRHPNPGRPQVMGVVTTPSGRANCLLFFGDSPVNRGILNGFPPLFVTRG